MADDIKRAEIQITSTYDGTGAQRAAADQEKLTIGQKNLAPATAEAAAAMSQFDAALSKESQELIRGTAAHEAYVIANEAEYVAIQKAHNALEARIPTLKAAGKDTAAYEMALANLSEALSSESALAIAERLEQEASNKAKLEAFEASQKKAAAEEEEAEATTVNTVAMREQLVVLRELMSGRFNRLPGSLSILAGASGAGPSLTNGIMMATMAFIGLEMAISAIERHDAPLEKVLVEDVGEGIDKANALAQAWDGIADAVADANDSFNSAEEIYARALKDMEGQLSLTEQLIQAEKELAETRLKNQRDTGKISEAAYEAGRAAIEGQAQKAQADARIKADQEALTQKANEAANMAAQSAAAEKKAAAIKLPQTDEQAKAEADAMAGVAKSNREKGEAEKGDAAQIRDAAVTASQGGIGALFETLLTPGFWKFAGHNFFNHGYDVSQYETGDQVARKDQASGASDIATANAADRTSGRIAQLIKERDAARAEAARLAGEAAKAQKDFDWEKDPNNAGSLAAKIKGESQVERIGEINAGESEFAADIKQIQKDLAVHGPGAQAAMKDTADALRDAVKTLATIAALGDDVRQFKQELADLRNQISRAQSGPNGMP